MCNKLVPLFGFNCAGKPVVSHYERLRPWPHEVVVPHTIKDTLSLMGIEITDEQHEAAITLSHDLHAFCAGLFISPEDAAQHLVHALRNTRDEEKEARQTLGLGDKR